MTILSRTGRIATRAVQALALVWILAVAVGALIIATTATPAQAAEDDPYGLGDVSNRVRAMVAEVAPMFDVTTVYGYRESATDPDGHPSGNAADFMVTGEQTKGDRIAEHLIANAERFGLDYLIWKQRIYQPETGEWAQMEDRGDDTQNHFDHVHAQTLPDDEAAPPTTTTAAEEICDTGPLPYIFPLCETAVGVAETGGGIIDFITDPAGAIAEGAGGFFRSVGNFIVERGEVDLQQEGYLTAYSAMVGIALLASVLQVLRTVGFHRNPFSQLWAIPGFGMFMLMSVIFPIMVIYGVQAVDLGIEPFTNVASNAMQEFFDSLAAMDGEYLGALDLGTQLVLLIALGLLYLLAGLAIWVELIIRAGLIYVLVLFYPVFALGYIEPASRPDSPSPGRERLSNYHTIIVGVILMKWVIAVILSLAAVLATSGSGEGMIIALGLIIIASFSPFAIIPLIGFAQGAAAGAALHHSLARTAAGARGLARR